MNIINPSGKCHHCGGVCPPWRLYDTMRCQNAAKVARRKLLDSTNAHFQEKAPYPLADADTLALLSQLMLENKVESPAVFDRVNEALVWDCPRGLVFTVDSKGGAKLEKKISSQS